MYICVYVCMYINEERVGRRRHPLEWTGEEKSTESKKAQDNWWGTSNTPKISNLTDDSGVGTVPPPSICLKPPQAG